MKKIISFLLFGFISISSVYSYTIFSKSGSIYSGGNSSSISDSDYKLEISCTNDESFAYINDIYYIKSGTLFSINYDGADVYFSGGNSEGSASARHQTLLKINTTVFNQFGVIQHDSEIVSQHHNYNGTFYAQNSSWYTISILFEEGGTAYEKPINIKIIVVNEISFNNGFACVPNYCGYLTYQGTSFSVYCANAVVKENFCAVKKGQPIQIFFQKSYTSDYSSGFSRNEKYTELRIDGIKTENIPFCTVEKEKTIELYEILKTSSGVLTETCLTKLTINVDSEKPVGLQISGYDNTWKKDNITLTPSASDGSGVGIYYYEYKDGNEWKRADSYTTNVQEGEIEEKTIDFRAVDYVGNISDMVTCMIKIDRTFPAVQPTLENEKWTNDGTITVADSGSGINSWYINNNLQSSSVYTVTKSGVYTVEVNDKAGNRIVKEIQIDLDAPNIITKTGNDTFYGKYTNCDVNVETTDVASGIKEFKINEIEQTNPCLLQNTAEYKIKSIDNVGNISERIIYIDKIKPVSSWNEPTFSGFGYRNEKECRLLDSITINYSVLEEDSGIKKNGNHLKINGSIIQEFSESIIAYNDRTTVNGINRLDDCSLIYSVDVEDNATNRSDTICKTFTVPREIQLQFVNESDETQSIKRTRVLNGYTTVGILLNKINFNLYETIRIKRFFLGDKEENEDTRNIVDYTYYKTKYNENVSESLIRQKWEAEQDCIITENDVIPVTIDGKSYWYYEDKINTNSGLGHRGIKYQAEWKWKEFDITEKGKYAEIDKTANNPGRVKVRLQGTNTDGTEVRYVVLNSSGEKIEDESDEDFHVPVDGIVRISFKIEDEDIDDYNVQATEIIKVAFSNSTTGNNEEHEITVPIEGFNSNGYIQKKISNGTVVSEYHKSGINDGWFEFDNPELKLYFNKTFNMKISMTEGCKGNSGKYKDITESGIFKLKAVNPDLGGFGLVVGNEAGYNTDGITSQPHKIISLALEEKGAGGQIDNVEWNFGDGESEMGLSTQHAYNQSVSRTGNTSEYIMNITFVQNQINKCASINVHIVDTQSGKLLGDEIWIGEHPVLNKLQVPSGVTLTIKNNDILSDNKTIILGAGSSDTERKGWLEVLSGGTLNIEEGSEKIVLTEGKNGINFTEVKTELDSGTDESFKWKGITINGGAQATLKNVEIKYAVTGLQVKNNTDVVLSKTEIRNSHLFGIMLEGRAVTDEITIDNCETGLHISETGIISVSRKIKINESQNGLFCDGLLSAESLEIKENHITGIVNNGNINIEENLFIEGSTNSGIRNEKTLTAKSIKITTTEGRGFVAGRGSVTQSEKTEINAQEIGIHCIGNANADFGKCNIKGVIYGIKTDRDESGSPTLKIHAGSRIGDAVVNWYDWKDGVLTDDEINKKMYEN